MLTINIPVCDKIIAVGVYINVDVNLRSLTPVSTRETLAIEQASAKLNGEIYTAVKKVMETLASAKAVQS